MNLAVFAFTRRGCDTARRAVGALRYDAVRMFTMAKFQQPDFENYTPPLAAFTEPVFQWADTILFIGSTGMAIRAIAPWVADKKTDPAVIVVDEAGQFAISLLSGHIGGANAETRLIAKALGAQSIITTATDVNRKFSVDDWAARNQLAISDMGTAKAIAAAILEQDIPMVCDFPIASPLPGGVVPADSGELGIYIGWRKKQPFPKTLQLIPKCLNLGIGCRRDTPTEKIEAAVAALLPDIPMEAIAKVVSIDLKSNEPGLLAFCERHRLPAVFYSAQQLKAVPGDFPASSFVSSITGVDNVCQRAAMLDGKTCILEKCAMDGVTVSVAEIEWEVFF